MLEGSVLLITGGTGSFGNAVLKKYLKSDISEIRIFSRDEKKQDDMRHLYQSDKIKYYIGDVRDQESIRRRSGANTSAENFSGFPTPRKGLVATRCRPAPTVGRPARRG